jgi:hypothetical protein
MSIDAIHDVPDAALDHVEGLLRATADRSAEGFATIVVGRAAADWRAEGPFLADDAARSEDLAARASAHLADRVYVGPVRVAELRWLWAVG